MTAIRSFPKNHPQITAWIVLAIGMVIILVWSAWSVGFTPPQWAALIVTTILLAGACVWIIGWGDDEDLEECDDSPAPEETPVVEAANEAITPAE